MSSKTLIQFEGFIDYVESLKDRVTQETWLNPISPGKWTLLELVSHLWHWDVYSIEKMIPLFKDGARLPQFIDLDLYNKLAIEKTKHFVDAKHLIHTFIETRREMIKKIEEIYNPNIRFTIERESNPFTIDSYVQIFVHHDEYHKKQIEKYISEG